MNAYAYRREPIDNALQIRYDLRVVFDKLPIHVYSENSFRTYLLLFYLPVGYKCHFNFEPKIILL